MCPNLHAQNELPRFGSDTGVRRFLPLHCASIGEFFGMLAARRIEVRPFTPRRSNYLKPSPIKP